MYNRDVVYSQDFNVKNNITVAPQQADNFHQLNDNSFADPINTNNNFTIESGVTTNMVAGKSITLNAGFETKPGCNFVAKIDNSLACNDKDYFMLKSPPHNKKIVSLNPIKPVAHDSLGLLVKHSVTSGQFSVCFRCIDTINLNQNANVCVWNMLGQLISKGQMIVNSQSEFQFNLSNQPHGMYLITAKTKDRMLHGKVILE